MHKKILVVEVCRHMKTSETEADYVVYWLHCAGVGADMIRDVLTHTALDPYVSNHIQDVGFVM